MPRSRKKTSPDSPFYGVPYQTIMERTGVTKQCAQRWKAGTATPSPQSLMLFALHEFGKVIPEKHSDWFFNRKSQNVVAPNGQEFDLKELLNIATMHQEISALKAELADANYRNELLKIEFEKLDKRQPKRCTYRRVSTYKNKKTPFQQKDLNQNKH